MSGTWLGIVPVRASGPVELHQQSTGCDGNAGKLPTFQRVYLIFNSILDLCLQLRILQV